MGSFNRNEGLNWSLIKWIDRSIHIPEHTSTISWNARLGKDKVKDAWYIRPTWKPFIELSLMQVKCWKEDVFTVAL